MINKDNHIEESHDQEHPEGGTSSQEHDAIWSISAVSRMTRLSQHTLRAWERRFGMPVPTRLPSGHRRYTQNQVEHLQMIARALRQGHRAGDIVPLDINKLKELLALTEPQPEQRKRPPSWSESVLEKATVFDRKSIADELIYSSAHLGIRSFLRERVAPLLDAIGDAWREGRIDVRHEHFISELLEDTLRSLRMPLEPNMTGSPILLAALSNELHGLGIQMVALTVALHGRQLRILGSNTPMDDILATSESLQPLAVGISVSTYTATTQTAAKINHLRSMLPPSTMLWVGGQGAAFLEGLTPGIQVLRSLDDLERCLEQLPKNNNSF